VGLDMAGADKAGSHRPDRLLRPGRRKRQWRSGRVAGIAVGLLLVERLLVDEVGSPRMLVGTLRDLSEPWADPVASVLALMALIAEVLAGYLLVVLALRPLGALPGTMGRLARRITVAVAPVVVRRLVDVLVGSTLLVQVTAAPSGASFSHRPGSPHETVVASLASGPSAGLAPERHPPLGLRAALLHPTVDSGKPVEARPIARRSAVPLPPWLRDGPSKPAPGRRLDAGEHTVEAGDTLWDIASAHLVPAERSAATIHRYWQRIYRANRSVIGADPDLIHPGTRLGVMPFRQAHP
jgi:LysM domain